TWTFTDGSALTLKYHAGCLGSPPCEATNRTRSPSGICSRGTVLGSPDFRPVVVTKHTGTGARSADPTRQLPPTRPPDPRYAQVLRREPSLITAPTRGAARRGSSVPVSGRGGSPDGVPV